VPLPGHQAAAYTREATEELVRTHKEPAVRRETRRQRLRRLECRWTSGARLVAALPPPLSCTQHRRGRPVRGSAAVGKLLRIRRLRAPAAARVWAPPLLLLTGPPLPCGGPTLPLRFLSKGRQQCLPLTPQESSCPCFSPDPASHRHTGTGGSVSLGGRLAGAWRGRGRGAGEQSRTGRGRGRPRTGVLGRRAVDSNALTRLSV
jgi:hypothetical protein